MFGEGSSDRPRLPTPTRQHDYDVPFPDGFDVPAIPFAVVQAGLGVTHQINRQLAAEYSAGDYDAVTGRVSISVR